MRMKRSRGLTEMECESWVEISAVFSHKAPLYWILTLTDLLSWQYSKKGTSGKTHRINRVTQESSKLVPYIWFWILMKWNAKNDFVTDSLDYKKKTVSCEETRVFLPDRTLRLHFVIPELVRCMRNFWESWTSFLSKKNFLKIKPKLLLVWLCCSAGIEEHFLWKILVYAVFALQNQKITVLCPF